MENILINYCTYYLAITKRFKMYLIFNKRITVPERKRKDRSVLFMYSKCFSLHVLKGAGITIFCFNFFRKQCRKVFLQPSPLHFVWDKNGKLSRNCGFYSKQSTKK